MPPFLKLRPGPRPCHHRFSQTPERRRHGDGAIGDRLAPALVRCVGARNRILLDLVLGRKLANSEQATRKIGWFEGVPAMGLDGLGSSSYGPEAALTVMIPLGAASLTWIGPVMAPIVALLIVLYFSYRQTVVAYPTRRMA